MTNHQTQSTHLEAESVGSWHMQQNPPAATLVTPAEQPLYAFQNDYWPFHQLQKECTQLPVDRHFVRSWDLDKEVALLQ